MNGEDLAPDSHLKAAPPGGMCPYIAALTNPDEVDAKLIAIVKKAWDAAG